MTKISIRVIPNAKKSEIVEGDVLRVRVKAPAIEGKANKELISVLSKHYKINKSKIRIVKGEKSRDKLVELG